MAGRVIKSRGPHSDRPSVPLDVCDADWVDGPVRDLTKSVYDLPTSTAIPSINLSCSVLSSQSRKPNHQRDVRTTASKRKEWFRKRIGY